MEQFRELEEDLSALFLTLDKKSLRNLGSFFKKQTRFFDYNRRKLQDEKGNNDVRKTRQRRRGNGRGGLMKAGLLVLMILVFVLGGMKLAGAGPFFDGYREMEGEAVDAFRPDMTVDLLTPNSYSRPETGTSRIRNIVLHYTANPGATAKQNRDYFEGLKDTHLTKASSHFIVGLDGEIVQCIPTWEVAYASNNRNGDTVSIECCHPDESGSFNQKTYDSMVRLSAWLCLKFNLTENDLIRHYDVTGKICPKYFVDYPEKWTQFQADVLKILEKKR